MNCWLPIVDILKNFKTYLNVTFIFISLKLIVEFHRIFWFIFQNKHKLSEYI